MVLDQPALGEHERPCHPDDRPDAHPRLVGRHRRVDQREDGDDDQDEVDHPGQRRGQQPRDRGDGPEQDAPAQGRIDRFPRPLHGGSAWKDSVMSASAAVPIHPSYTAARRFSTGAIPRVSYTGTATRSSSRSKRIEPASAATSMSTGSERSTSRCGRRRRRSRGRRPRRARSRARASVREHVHLLGVDQADERQDAADHARGGRVDELAVDQEDRDRAEDHAHEHRPGTERREAAVEHAAVGQRLRPDPVDARARGQQRVMDHARAPLRERRDRRQDDRGVVRLGHRGERLRADRHADEQQHRHDRRDRQQRPEQREQPEHAEREDQQAGGQRVGDAAAGRLPARLADVDGGRERRAQRRADHGAGAVGQQHVAQVVVVARGRGRLRRCSSPR